MLILLLVLLPLISIQALAQSDTVKLIPTDDSYVVGDVGDNSDPLGVMASNNGAEESIRLVSSLNVQGIPGEYISIGYLKFDLSEYEISNIVNAQLKMLSKEVILSSGPKNIVVSLVTDDNWDENQITFNQRPFYSTELSVNKAVSTNEVWNFWDITELVKANQNSEEISLGILFEEGFENVGETVVFHSKESGNEFAPYLELSLLPSAMGSSQAQDSFAYTLILVIGAAAVAFFVGMQISKRKSPPTRQTTQQQKIRKVQCQGCGKMMPDYYKFCPACGNSFS